MNKPVAIGAVLMLLIPLLVIIIATGGGACDVTGGGGEGGDDSEVGKNVDPEDIPVESVGPYSKDPQLMNTGADHERGRRRGAEREGSDHRHHDRDR